LVNLPRSLRDDCDPGIDNDSDYGCRIWWGNRRLVAPGLEIAASVRAGISRRLNMYTIGAKNIGSLRSFKQRASAAELGRGPETRMIEAESVSKYKGDDATRCRV